MTAPITVSGLLRSISDHCEIYLDERCAGYLQSQRGPLLTAINMGNEESIAAIVTKAILGALQAAGYKGHLTPNSLRALLSDPTVGVRAIHDVVEGRENALSHLSAFLANAHNPGLGGHRHTSRPHHAAPHDQRSPAPQPQRSAEAPQRGPHSGQGPVSRGSAPAPSREPEQPNPARGVDRGFADDDQNPFPRGPEPRGAHSTQPPQRGRTNDVPPPERAAPPSNRSQNNVTPIDGQRNVRESYAPRGSGMEERDADQRDGQTRRFEQKNVYGSKASVQFSPGLTVGTEKKEPRPTIYMEAARMLDPQKRVYDWKNKIKLQLTAHEQQIVTALLFGLVQHCKFANHGHPGEADKWFEFEHQQGQYAGTIKIAVGKGKDVMITSLGAEDLGDVTAMFLRQCAEQMRIEQAAVPATLRAVAQAYNARNSARAAGQRRAG